MSHDGWGEVDSQSFRCHLEDEGEGGRGKREGQEGGARGRGSDEESKYHYIK